MTRAGPPPGGDRPPLSIRKAVRASLRLLDRRDRRLLGFAVIAQVATAVLDLIGVVLIGAVGALSVANMQGLPPPQRLASAVSALGLGDLSPVGLIGVLAGAAAVLLLTKSVVSPLLMARVYRFLAGREALVASRLAKALLSRPLTFLHQRPSQVTAKALVDGVGAAIIYVLGQAVVAVSEASLLAVLTLVLLMANPGAALGAVVFFALVGLGLQKALGAQASRFGSNWLNASVAGFSAVQEALGSYRELTVANRRSLYVDRIHELRRRQSRASAGTQLINLLPKYISEAALVLGSFALAVALFSTQSVEVAVGTFTLFLAAATRVMPSLLRLQSATLAMRTAAGLASHTFALAEDLGNPIDDLDPEEVRETIRQSLTRGYPDFVPTIELRHVTFSYPDAEAPAMRDVSIEVGDGQSIALIGGSGAGKSTLADLILGVLDPDSGTVRIAGVTPSEAINRWPGGIAYVPQDVVLVDDTVRANVALGLPRDAVDDQVVWEALDRAQLSDHIRSLPDGLDTQIGERGLRLSGGQRQRLGIARALSTLPRLLVLDEATSALDAETEHAVAKMLAELGPDVTTVIVAHRLSTVRNADLVVYLADGAVQAQGTFDEVRDRVPALVRQAALMGLTANSESA